MRSVRLLVALYLALLAAAAFADTAGQVMFAYGQTHALRQGRIIPLQAGSSIESGDELHTGVDSYLQLRFTDWGVMTLRPRTDFVIDQYEYEQRRGGAERAFFTLLAGGVRSVTGLIGHRNRSNYRVRTRMTAIGIRGTHYAVIICEQSCKLEDGSFGEDGVYGGVLEGRIAVSPYGGPALEREFGAGEYFRLASATSVPEPFFTPPPFFWDRREPQARAGGRTFAGIPWKPAPGAAPSDGSVASGDPTGTGGSLLRTNGSLTLSPITAPVLNQVATPVLSPVTSTIGATASAIVTPVAAPIAPVLGSAVGAVVSPVAPVVGSVVAPVASVVAPVIAPIAPVVGPVVAPVTPVVAPVVAVVAPVITPVVAPVAPVVAPVVPVVPAPIAPVITTPPPAVSLPTVPSLPVVGGLPSLRR